MATSSAMAKPLAGLVSFLLLPALTFSADWPQWRGPNRDGVVHGVTAPEKWPRTLKEEWQLPVGEGVASPVMVGDNVYVFTRQQDAELVLCIDLASGKENWRSEPYPAPFRPGPGDAFSIGPRSTPAVAGGRVFTLGISGILSSLDARTGRLLWRKDRRPYFSRSGNSPLVADGLCIVHLGDGNSGGLTAFDSATGEVKWCFNDGSSPASSSPILVNLAGERQVVTFTRQDLLGVSAATGKLLWRFRCYHDYFENCVTPLQYKDLLIAAGRNEPPLALRLEKGEQGIGLKQVWKAKGSPSYLSSPVQAGDWLFGLSDQRSGHLFCLDAKTGATLWQSDGRLGSYASILNAGSVWLVLTNKGQLLVVKASGTAYEPLAEYRVSNTDTYAHPVFLGERILIRDATTLRSFRIEPDAGKRSGESKRTP